MLAESPVRRVCERTDELPTEQARPLRVRPERLQILLREGAAGLLSCLSARAASCEQQQELKHREGCNQDCLQDRCSLMTMARR